MKKLSELSTEEKRILAAEACGWTHLEGVWGLIPNRPSNHHHYERPLPDYGNDLNSMAFAMDSLNAIQREDFVKALCRIICGPEVEYHQMHLCEMFRFANATAAQRLDAFLLAKGLCE